MKSFLGSLRRFAFFIAALIPNAGAFAQSTAQSPLPVPSPALSLTEIRDIAESAYIFAYPLVLLNFTKNNAPTNVFTHLSEFPSASFRTVVRPNADTLYSIAWLDLAKEPLLLHVPDTGRRFYLLQFMDAWTETFADPGKRTTGTGQGWFAVVGPSWHGKLPPEVHELDSTTNDVWLIGRIQTNTAADYENVHRIQKGFILTPLSRYPESMPPAASAASFFQEGSVPPPTRVAQLGAIEFFREFQRLLTQNPPHAADAPMMKQLALLGLEPGKPFEPEKLGIEGMKAMEEGVRVATIRLTAAKGSNKNSKNGWSGFGLHEPPHGQYGTDYFSRARTARIGFALQPEDAVYGGCSADKDGNPFNGKNHYQIHFSSENLPPVRAFWSLTLYDPAGYFYANPLDRYAIGDRDALDRNPDGSLDIYIQHEAPGGSKDRNWLPTPEGEFVLLLRLYWPEQAVLDGRWTPPEVTHLP